MNWLNNYVTNRIVVNDKNFLGFVWGQTGSGKSSWTLSACESIDKNFGIHNVCFTFKDFAKLIGSDEIRKGNCVICEEVGVSASNRDWFTKSNKRNNSILQTFRDMNAAVFFNSPKANFADFQLRQLTHMYFETKGINKRDKTVKCLPSLVSPETSYYPKRPIAYENGMRGIITHVTLPMCSSSLWEEYVELSKKFKQSVRQDGNDPSFEALSNEEIISFIKENPEEYVDGRGRIDIYNIVKIFKIGSLKLGIIRKEVEPFLIEWWNKQITKKM